MGETPFKSATELLKIPTAAQPTGGQGLVLNHSGILPLAVLPTVLAGVNTMLAGTVSSTGTVIAGSGFTPTHVATGHYTLAYATGYTTAPCVIVTTVVAVGSIVNLSGPTTTGVDVWVWTITAGPTYTLTDSQFNFIVTPIV